MSMLAIKVPSDIGHLLEKIEVPGHKEDIDDYHITLFCFDDDMPLNDFVECMSPIAKEVRKTNVFTIATGKLHSFPDKKQVPIVVDIKSEPLHELQKRIANAFDEKGINYDKEFKYNPHLTLSYANKEIESKDIDKIKFDVDNVVLYGGHKEDDQIKIVFQFGDNEKNSVLKKKVIVFNAFASIK